jgi:hypothetical protein
VASGRRTKADANSRQQLNHWKKLEYHDPAEILKRLRALEIELADVQMDDRVRRLRTAELKRYREWRDAALFLYGLGLAQGRKIYYATLEESDYDFVASWIEDTTQHFCPVQLKELPPADLNSRVDLEKILAGSVKDPRPTSTVLAVRLNRRGHIELKGLRVPQNWKQVWFFWASGPNSSNFTVYGDALNDPGQYSFDYPS